jgi:hypothetical protein
VSGACSAALVQSFWNDCLSATATSQTCSGSWGSSAPQANRTCLACLITSNDAPMLGPILENVALGVVSLNAPGCVELEDPTSAGLACAKALQATSACDERACSSCVVRTDADLVALQRCEVDADNNECATWANQTTCVDTEGNPDGGAAAPCLRSQSFEAAYTTLATIFCGP